ncbi:hypothetical protein G6F32_016194 [Rhizopus arrhizus]|nr:hypothetical protein G6F32_016194 [Rhizopus arrhizus]
MVQLLAAIEDGGEDAGILVDAQRTVGTVRRSDQAQLAALAVRCEVGLLVGRGDVLRIREDPDLQEVHGLVGRVVELARSTEPVPIESLCSSAPPST